MLLSWHIWVILGILLLIGEIFTPAFFLACFAVGAFAAALLFPFGASLNVQIFVFALVSLVCAFAVRPFVLRFLSKKEGEIKTGMRAMEGKTGHVTEAFGGPGKYGYVRIGGEDWRACGLHEEFFSKDELVVVDSVSGVTLWIRKQDLSETAAI